MAKATLPKIKYDQNAGRNFRAISMVNSRAEWPFAGCADDSVFCDDRVAESDEPETSSSFNSN